MAIHLATPISQLTRVGAVTAKRLAKLGISNVRELLEHYPVRYEDYTRILDTRRLERGLVGSIIGTITAIEKKETSYKKMKLSEAYLDDGFGEIKLIWFNQPFITETLKEGDKIIAAGAVEQDFQGWVMKNPAYEKAALEKTLHTARLVPVYPATYGLTQKQLRFLISQAMSALGEFREIIPEQIKKQAKLGSRPDAIRAIHLPADNNDWQRALRYLKFEELLLTQILTEQSRRSLESAQAPNIPFQEQATKKLVSSLPFKLTDDQRKAAWQILKDLSQNKPMNRLLQGEVGSGKTVVAAIAALNAAESGFQAALMAPTEILALQHYQTINRLFPDKPVALLTSKHSRLSTHVILNEAKRSEESQSISTRSFDSVPLARDSAQDDGVQISSRNDIKKAITDGKVDIVIGTHAIIQNDVIFKKLGLIVIDEQHRFGVEQRKQLKDKSKDDAVPHLLSMTATPIPRSLALTVYGDLDISTIRQLPANRKPIATKIIENSGRAETYGFISEKIKTGRQVFVVCPLIEESDVLGVKSATAEFEKLRQIFPDAKIGLLHGKLKSKEKEQVMNDFSAQGGSASGGKNNRIDILVATAVIEVGVDVPNASIMVIEGAERFGLAQLHQFRGRVGRGEHASFCFLFPTTASAQTKHRLQSFVAARDGFEIADLDLRLRGPGQIYGTTQSGWLTGLKIAQLTDSELISETKTFAREILSADPGLKLYPELGRELERMNRALHLE